MLHESLLNGWLHRPCCSLGSEYLEGRAGWPAARAPYWERPAASDGLTLPADINECVTDLHTCSRGEHCMNTVGSFRCYKALTCESGYMLKDGECTGEASWLEAPPTSPPPPHLLIRPQPACSPPGPPRAFSLLASSQPWGFLRWFRGRGWGGGWPPR